MREPVTWAEAAEYAELVAAFYARHNRNANDIETMAMVIQARALVVAKARPH